MRDLHADDHRGLSFLCAALLVAVILAAAVILNRLIGHPPPVHIGVGYGI